MTFVVAVEGDARKTKRRTYQIRGNVTTPKVEIQKEKKGSFPRREKGENLGVPAILLLHMQMHETLIIRDCEKHQTEG